MLMSLDATDNVLFISVRMNAMTALRNVDVTAAVQQNKAASDGEQRRQTAAQISPD